MSCDMLSARQLNRLESTDAVSEDLLALEECRGQMFVICLPQVFLLTLTLLARPHRLLTSCFEAKRCSFLLQGPLINRGEAHITTITPPEFSVLNAPPANVTINEINKIALKANIQVLIIFPAPLSHKEYKLFFLQHPSGPHLYPTHLRKTATPLKLC